MNSGWFPRQPKHCAGWCGARVPIPGPSLVPALPDLGSFGAGGLPLHKLKQPIWSLSDHTPGSTRQPEVCGFVVPARVTRRVFRLAGGPQAIGRKTDLWGDRSFALNSQLGTQEHKTERHRVVEGVMHAILLEDVRTGVVKSLLL
jgi:hypothetical protein